MIKASSLFLDNRLTIYVDTSELAQSHIDSISLWTRNDYDYFQSSKTHAIFFILQIPFSKFEPGHHYFYDSASPSMKVRGGLYFYPPISCWKYTLKVSGLFDGGNDSWIGSSNSVGEWAVAYHGTSCKNLYSMLNSPMRAGERAAYGKGIYISPYFSTAEDYS
jgi:hypothetical protein